MKNFHLNWYFEMDKFDVKISSSNDSKLKSKLTFACYAYGDTSFNCSQCCECIHLSPHSHDTIPTETVDCIDNKVASSFTISLY